MIVVEVVKMFEVVEMVKVAEVVEVVKMMEAAEIAAGVSWGLRTRLPLISLAVALTVDDSRSWRYLVV